MSRPGDPGGLSALETAVGFPFGGTVGAPAPASSPGTPSAVLARVLAEELDRGPLAIAFSGGRDSSLLLAAATAVARDRGQPAPVPVTLRPPAEFEESDETAWQEQVIAHVGVDDWYRVEVGEELDLVGPCAQPGLVRDGPSFPANAHSIVPLVNGAAGRKVASGLGGDELFSPHQWHAVHQLMGRHRRPGGRDVVRLGAATLPRPLRARLRATTSWTEDLGWVMPSARPGIGRALTVGFEEPVLWSNAVRNASVRRDVALADRSMRSQAEAAGGRAWAPLLDPTVVAALARAGGASGWGSRTAAMRAIGGELLPDAVLSRVGKASFNRSFFGPESRAFATRWSGEGLEDFPVDADELRREWLSDVPDFRTAMLLQVAWLRDQGR